MKNIRQFSIIAFMVVSVSACQSISLPAIPGMGSKSEPTEPVPEAPGLNQLVAEEPVIAAAMPVSSDGQDDIIEREDDPLPLEPEPTQAQVEDLWARLRDGFKLDHHLDEKRVQAELNWYVRHPDYLDRVATRASRYLFHIVEEIERRDLPMELALLPIVESAFDPFAYSHGRASGLWQFIPSTGKLYGLKINYWYDGRRDVVRATDAALKYLTDSYNSLNNDWLLSLAAYNSGEGNVRYSMRKNTREGKPLDFFSLGLLRETRAYVPRLLAISAIVAEPEKYGVTLKPLINAPYFDQVALDSQIDLAIAARLADISIEELYLLNPAYNKWSTDPDGPFSLLVPFEKADAFRTALNETPVDQRLSFRQHKIRSGETLGNIASRYKTNVATLQKVNNIRGHMIVAGDSLLIPVAAASSENYQLSDSERLKSTQEYVEKKMGVEPVKYVVRNGDTLWDLSREFGVSMRSLAKWNGMATTDPLFPGKELLVFNPSESWLQVAALPAQNEVIRKVNYRVRRGESLSLIASKFNLSINNIKKWNEKVTKQKYLQPGDRITLYVDVTETYE